MICPRKNIWRLCIAGLATGLINGFFGAGGGMVLVPLLTGFCNLEDKEAFASSVCIILPICLVSLVVYAIHSRIPWSEALPYLLGGLGGGILGGVVFKNISASLLHKLLGGFILWGGLRLVLQ